MAGMGRGGLAEWKAAGMLPVAAALGYASSVIHIYGLGPYIEPVSQEFGWSRTQVTIGLTLCTLVQAVAAIPIGMAVDRLGPRILGVIGVLLSAGAFSLMGTATGDVGNWYFLWMLMALATLPVQATVWTSAVASRFTASRGLAFAITLCGASIASALFPYMGTTLIENVGWRSAFSMQALIWSVCSFPIIFLFFRTGLERGKSKAKVDRVAAGSEPIVPVQQSGITFKEGLVSSVYWRLMLASLLFTFTIMGLVVNFVPILTSSGFNTQQAAGVAALIGLTSIVGRLGTGLALDRFSGSLVGSIVFLLPVVSAFLLASFGGDMTFVIIAAIFIGVTLGAEIDVIVYLTTRHFGLRSFGALYGGLLAALSVGTAFGPVIASRVYDLTGNYTQFIWLAMGLMLLSSLSLGTLPRPKD